MSSVTPLHNENQGDGIESIWDKGTLKKVADFCSLVGDIKNKRDALTAERAAGLAPLIAMGFNKDALEAAIKYAETDENKRENFDLSYLFARKAVGHPVQDDLFVAAAAQQVKVSMSKKANGDEGED